MPQETIILRFEPKGDKELIAAINALAKAQLTLENKTAKLTKAQLQNSAIVQGHEKVIHKFNIKLKALGSGLDKVTGSAKLQALALKGDEIALERLRLAVNKHTASLGRNTKGVLSSVHANRILGGSFAVLRSKLLIGAFAVTRFERAVMSLVRAYADQQQAELRVQNAIRATGMAAGITFKEIKALASELQKNGVIGDEVNLKMASLMLTYDKIGKTVFPRAVKAMNDMAIAQSMGIPTSEELRTTTTMLAKALQEPTKGINALRRVGFSLSAQQRQQVKEFMAVGKVAEAQNIILGAAERQYGGLASSIKDSTLGAVEQLSMAWGDAGENIGAVLSEAILPLVDRLKTFQKHWTQKEPKHILKLSKVLESQWGFM